MKISNKYQEILRLDDMLTASNIPHTTRPYMGGWQVCYPDSDSRVVSVIEHTGSYGNELDKLEIMGLLTPDEASFDHVVGYLSAENVFGRIKKHWEGDRNMSEVINENGCRELTDYERSLHRKISELECNMVEVTYRADRAESDNRMLRECIVKMALERTGCDK